MGIGTEVEDWKSVVTPTPATTVMSRRIGSSCDSLTAFTSQGSQTGCSNSICSPHVIVKDWDIFRNAVVSPSRKPGCVSHRQALLAVHPAQRLCFADKSIHNCLPLVRAYGIS